MQSSKEYLDNIDSYNFTREEIEDDFDEMLNILEDINLGENSYYPDELTDLMEKYNPDWWESDFVGVGKRIDQRVVLWAVGYQMALQQIQG